MSNYVMQYYHYVIEILQNFYCGVMSRRGFESEATIFQQAAFRILSVACNAFFNIVSPLAEDNSIKINGNNLINKDSTINNKDGVIDDIS